MQLRKPHPFLGDSPSFSSKSLMCTYRKFFAHLHLTKPEPVHRQKGKGKRGKSGVYYRSTSLSTFGLFIFSPPPPTSLSPSYSCFFSSCPLWPHASFLFCVDDLKYVHARWKQCARAPGPKALLLLLILLAPALHKRPWGSDCLHKRRVPRHRHHS